MYNYFVVVGLKTKHAEFIQSAIDKIIDQLQVETFSKAYIAGSEDSQYPGEYINFAFQVSSDSNLAIFKKQTSIIEQFFYINGKKSVDLDIILQMHAHDTLFSDPTINRYCHTLITLNDIIPNQIVANQSIQERLSNHPNKGIFTEYLECHLQI